MEEKIRQGGRSKVTSNIFTAELLALFNDVETNFIETLCEEMCAQGLMIDRAGLDFLIDHLLCESPNHLKNQSTNKRNQMIDICEKYKYIRDVFPDIEPKYLMEYLTMNRDSPQKSWQNTYNFIKFFIISHYYPRIDDYIERLKRTEQVRWLTTDFQIDEFLELFPDPFKHFEDKNRKCRFSYIVLDFLKKLFNRHQVRTIEDLYKSNKYNASLASKELANLKPDIKNRRKMMQRQTDNINLLQEFAFIKNRKAIQMYMDESRTREVELTKRFKKLNFPLKCEYCFEKECYLDACCTCDKGHVFCVDCTSQGIGAFLSGNGKARLECFTQCGGQVSAAGLQKIWQNLKITPFMGREQIDKPKANPKNLVSCPFCRFVSVPSLQNNVFKCLNPKCMEEICCICKKRNHAPHTCKTSTNSVLPKSALPRKRLHQVDQNANHVSTRRFLLPPVRARDVPKKCLLIDLDETLVHCSFKPINNADFMVYVGNVGPDIYYVRKRPHVDEFLQRMGELYECVLFTASVAEYANPIVNLLDKWGVFRARLFRDSCVSQNGHYVKDLERLGRDLQKVAILDDRPASYSYQPDNGVSITPWYGDKTDSKLLDLIPFFERLSKVENVYSVLCNRQRK